MHSISSESQPNVKDSKASLEAASIHCCAEAAVVLVPEPSLEHDLCSSSEPILGWLTPRHSFLFSIPLHCGSSHPSKASVELQGFRLSLAQLLPRRGSRNDSWSIQSPQMLHSATSLPISSFPI